MWPNADKFDEIFATLIFVTLMKVNPCAGAVTCTFYRINEVLFKINIVFIKKKYIVINICT